MKKNYTYKWNSFNLNVPCTKCGNNIILQEFEGNPTCNECGNINKRDWPLVLREVLSIFKFGDSKRISMSSCKANWEPVEKINCYHCKSIIEITEESDLKNYSCSSCNQSLNFNEFEQLEDIVLYKCGAINSAQEAAKLIAVRCISCGAPLEVDSTKNNFHCQFCSTDNVLPMSLRYKVVLDDIFVGERISLTNKSQEI